MIKNAIKYTVSAVMLGTMIYTTPALAAPDDTPVTQEQIAATQKQIQEFETKVQKLDDRITMSMEKSQKLNAQIKDQQGKITETETEIDKAEKDLEAHKQVLSERLQSIQLDGQQSMLAYAELLLSSGSVSEFFNRFTAISQILKSDTDLMDGLNEKQQALEEAEEKLHKELDQLKKNEAELASEQKKIEEDKKEIEKELTNSKDLLQSQEAKLAQQELEAQRALEAQKALEAQQVQEAQQSPATQQIQQQSQNSQQSTSVKKAAPTTPKVSAVKQTTSTSASNIIATAKQYLGVPYVWGGSTPRGFDCSGFTSYVFRANGISLPRVSRDQQNVGTRISPSQVQPGDLVFNGSPAYHVGIYIGGGQYIHAPQTGDVVKIASYNPAKFSSAARVLR